MGLLRLEFLQTPVTYSKLQTGSNSLGLLLLIQVLGIWKRGCQGSDSVRHWENPLISQSANCAWMQTLSLARCFRQSDINEDQAGRVCLTMPLGMRGRMPQHWILGVGMLCHHRSSWHFLVQWAMDNGRCGFTVSQYLYSASLCRQVAPNVFNYSSLLRACGNAGQWQLVWELFKDMHGDPGCQKWVKVEPLSDTMLFIGAWKQQSGKLEQLEHSRAMSQPGCKFQ